MNSYSINVATQPCRNAAYGRHYCRIELGDCMLEEAVEKFTKLQEKLGDEFRLTLSVTEQYSTEIAGYCLTMDGMEWKEA